MDRHQFIDFKLLSPGGDTPGWTSLTPPPVKKDSSPPTKAGNILHKLIQLDQANPS